MHCKNSGTHSDIHSVDARFRRELGAENARYQKERAVTDGEEEDPTEGANCWLLLTSLLSGHEIYVPQTSSLH